MACDDSLAQLHQFYNVQLHGRASACGISHKQKTLAYDPPFTNDELDAWIKDIYANGSDAGLNWQAINKYANTYWDAVKAGYGSSVDSHTITSPDGVMLQHLMDNVYQFSAAKNYTHLHQLTRLINDNGKIREWKSFVAEAQKLNLLFNKTWLKTEYDLALAGSTMASKWVQFSSTGDRTMLRYATIGDARVRKEHADLNGITLPITHSFWNTHYPPNGFKCRCDVERIPYSAPQSDEHRIAAIPNDTVPPLFKTNLAKDKLVFPKGHAYFKGEVAYDSCAFKINNEEMNLKSSNIFETDIKIPKGTNNNAKSWLEYHKKYNAADIIANHFNENIFIMPEINYQDARHFFVFKNNVYPTKSPDFLFKNEYFEMKGHDKNWNDKRLKAMLSNGREQAQNIIINMTEDFINEIDVIKNIKISMASDSPRLLKRVIIIKKDGSIIDIKKPNT